MYELCCQELPEQWNTVKKLSVAMKQNVAPLQANEVNILRRKLATFDVQQHEFREKFRKTAPFAYNADYIYARIDRVRERERALNIKYIIISLLFFRSIMKSVRKKQK